MSGDLSWRHSITPFDPNLLFAQRKSRTFDQALKHAIALMAQGSYKGDMPKKILVVDNELRSRQLIAYLLREESYEIDEADDGVSALAILEKKNFDLMICDVVMPRLRIGRHRLHEVPFTIHFNHTHNRSPLSACRKRARKLTLFL